MALADVYELRLVGRIHQETWNMVFHALRAGAQFTAENVVSAFGDSVLPLIDGMCGTDVLFDSVEAKSLGNPLDFYAAGLGGAAGNQAGESLGPFAAMSIQFPRKRVDMHHGYKRLPGCVEGNQDDGLLTAGALASLQTVADGVIDDWEELAAPGVTVANYIVVKRVLDSGVYRLPQVDGELVYYVPDSGIAQQRVSTQNTRKYNR